MIPAMGDVLGKRVELRTPDGELWGRGSAVGYFSGPSYVVDLDDGRGRTGWSASLTSQDPTDAERVLLSGGEAALLPVGAIVRWHRDRSEQGLRMHTPTEGWVPPISGGKTPAYLVVHAPDVPVAAVVESEIGETR